MTWRDTTPWKTSEHSSTWTARTRLALHTLLSLQECTHRKVVHNDGKGRQRVEVDHRSEWRFLWHHGSFTTSLIVEQVS